MDKSIAKPKTSDSMRSTAFIFFLLALLAVAGLSTVVGRRLRRDFGSRAERLGRQIAEVTDSEREQAAVLLLADGDGAKVTPETLEMTSRLIEKKLSDFGVEVRVVAAHHGAVAVSAVAAKHSVSRPFDSSSPFFLLPDLAECDLLDSQWDSVP